MSWTAVRYVKQQNNYSCGPVAILNVLKWVGVAVTYAQHYTQLVRDCRSKGAEESDHGTSSGFFDTTLRKYAKQHMLIRKPRKCSYQQFEAHLAAGGAAVVCFQHEEGSHFSFFPEYNSSDKLFLGINHIVNQTFTECSTSELKTIFRTSTHLRVWLLTRLK